MTLSYTKQGDAARTVVFLHGVGSGKEGFAQQQEAVVEAGWRFLAVDAPGFGAAPMPDAPGFAPHVAGLRAVLDLEGIERAVLCGHSLGGMTAQEFYVRYPDRVQGLVLSATSPAFGKPDGDFQKEFLRARFEPFERGLTMAEFARQFSAKLLGPNPPASAASAVEQVMARVSIEAYRLAMQTIVGFDQRANLPKIAVPTLLIAGDHDSNSPAKMMERMASHIPNARFVCLRDTGHMAPLENPEAFNHHLIRYLNELS